MKMLSFSIVGLTTSLEELILVSALPYPSEIPSKLK